MTVAEEINRQKIDHVLKLVILVLVSVQINAGTPGMTENNCGL